MDPSDIQLAAATLTRDFFDRPTDLVARALIGCRVLHRDAQAKGLPRLGRIVETEAYMGERDLACHAARGRTARTEVMFGPPGFAYVFFIYGMHFCLNAVTREPGRAEAVLIRAIEPLAHCLGRGDGPGLVCRALAIDRRLNGADLTASALTFLGPERPAAAIAVGPRVGVEYAGAWARRRLRFWERCSPFVSRAGGARGHASRRKGGRGMRAR